MSVSSFLLIISFLWGTPKLNTNINYYYIKYFYFSKSEAIEPENNNLIIVVYSYHVVFRSGVNCANRLVD